jgi:putative sigma-54 modulation protein
MQPLRGGVRPLKALHGPTRAAPCPDRHPNPGYRDAAAICAPRVGQTVRPAFPDVPHEEFVMQITIQGHQVDVTPALRDYAMGKFDRVARHFDHLHELNVVLGIEKVLHKAEATMQFSGRKAGRTLHADATATDMYAAIDALVDKIDKQVRKHKEKLTDHHAESVRATRYTTE